MGAHAVAKAAFEKAASNPTGGRAHRNEREREPAAASGDNCVHSTFAYGVTTITFLTSACAAVVVTA